MEEKERCVIKPRSIPIPIGVGNDVPDGAFIGHKSCAPKLDIDQDVGVRVGLLISTLELISS